MTTSDEVDCPAGKHLKPPLQYKDWRSPVPFFERLHEQYRFTMDAAANDDNTLLPRYCTVDGKFEKKGHGLVKLADTDGLDPKSWEGEVVFCNPPYEASGSVAIENWLGVAATHVAQKSLLLLPPSVDAKWFHKHLWYGVKFEKLGYREMSRPGVDVQFYEGRLRFRYRCELCGELVTGPAPRAGNLIAVFDGIRRGHAN